VGEELSNLKLRAGDIIVNINTGRDPWSVIRRWGLGSPYTHCFMYMGVLRFGATRYRACAGRLPMIFESMGRGVSLRMLSDRYGQEVLVIRLTKYKRRISQVLREAIKLASDEKSYYDYFCVVKYIIPRIIWEKLHLPLGKMPLSWHRDSRQICSEALLEICLRAGVPVLPDGVAPLPGDFVTDSGLLVEVGTGRLSEEWV